MIIFISWIWWVVWSGVWKCQQLVLSTKYWNLFLVLKIGHLDVYILHSKCEKFPTIFVSCQNLLKRFNLTWFSLYFGLHPLFEPETKKEGIYQFYPLFSMKYVLNYENSLVTIKQNDFLKKKLVTLIVFHDLWIEFKKWVQGKIGEKSVCTVILVRFWTPSK